MDVPRSFSWRPKTTLILLGGFVAILIALVVSFAIDHFKPTVGVQLGSGQFSLWLADTDASRVKGLSGVEKLSINGGLLMVYDTEEKPGIWMKDMKIPLDVIWLDRTKKVVHIEQNLDPNLGTTRTFVPTKPAQYVIELPAGAVKKAGIRTGQTAQFSVKGE